MAQIGNPGIPQGWQDLKVGAGGYLTGSSICSDNSYVVRTDTYGAYLWNASATIPQGNNGPTSGAWQQLVTPSTMPAAFTAIGQLYNDGVYEIEFAPTNCNMLYMVYDAAQARVNPVK